MLKRVAEALKDLLSLNQVDELKAKDLLKEILEESRGKLEDIKFDPNANTDYEGDAEKPQKQADEEVDESE